MVMETVSLVGSPAQAGAGLRSIPADLEDGVPEEVLTRRRSGTLPIFGAANSHKPVNIIFAPPNNLARYSPPQQPRRTLTIPFVGEMTSEVLKKWLRDPFNWPIIAWGLAVFVSGAVLFMVMVGMLNRSLPRKATRDLYFEASNQTINALFTLFVLLLHPVRVLHLVWLLRWRPKDAVKLRNVYCKGGLPKPNEWMHMLIVLLLYQINCFAQYASCALNWAYTRSDRPVIPVVLCFVTALSAGCAAGIYTSVSPLGKGEADEDEGRDATLPGPRFLHTPPKYDRLLDRATTPSTSRPRADHVLVENPQWQGGVFSCWEAPALVAATICCFPCVLGHNLSRLGFGNRYVHVITFTLACFSPFLIFECGSINVPSRSLPSPMTHIKTSTLGFHASWIVLHVWL